MIYVEDLDAALAYYRDVFGLRPRWRDKGQVGLGMPESEAEIVLHTDRGIPHQVEVHYLVDDADAAAATVAATGGAILVAPFDIVIGRCAVVRDPFGTTVCLLDMSKGHRELNLEA